MRFHRTHMSLAPLALVCAIVVMLACAPPHSVGGAPAPLPSATPSDTASPPHPHAPFEATSRHSFSDVKHWKSVFDDPARDAWQKPEAVIQALDILPDMRIADLGAGTGYFTAHLARAVGANGSVFAVETEPNLVIYLRERAERERTANVVPVLASADNPRLPYHALDLVLIVDTFHHLDDRGEYFRRLTDVLAPAGRIAIIDFRAGDLPVGPPPEHKIARDQVVAELRSAGYVLVAEPNLLPYQYFLVFRPE